jgi:tetrahydromethanopterin S-methyltransferase subunit G
MKIGIIMGLVIGILRALLFLLSVITWELFKRDFV